MLAINLFGGAATVLLERLRITGGSATEAAGISHQGAFLRLTACTLFNNSATNGNGGGIGVTSVSVLEMVNSRVEHNGTVAAGSSGGGIISLGSTTLTDCVIDNNSAAQGGGIGTFGGLSLIDSAVQNNTAATVGGGIYLGDGATTLLGTTTVRDNHADPLVDSRGGGIYANVGTLRVEETCRITRNTAAAGPKGGGGGIYDDAATLTLEGTAPSPIVVNNCPDNCGGVSVDHCAATPVSC